MTYYDDGFNQSLAESVQDDDNHNIPMDSKMDANFNPIGNSYEWARTFTIKLSMAMMFTGIILFLFAFLGPQIIDIFGLDPDIY